MSHLSGGGGPTGNNQTRSALEVCQPSRLMSGELDDSDDMSGNNDPSTETDNSGDGRPSNTTLLCTAFASFMTFATVQLFFAFLAGSSAMKGDSAAMIVDSMTYLFNWYAERRKARFDEENTADATESEREERIMLREKRKLVLRLEIIPPLISVTTLVAVTIVILKQAIEVLVLDTKRSEAEQAKPNIKLMMAFSIVNLGLDFLNVFCFARARRLLGFETKIDAHQVEDYGCADPTSAISSSVSDKNKTGSLYVHMNREQNGNGEASDTLHDEDDGFDGNELQAPDGNGDKANLNMVRWSSWVTNGLTSHLDPDLSTIICTFSARRTPTSSLIPSEVLP